MLEIVLIALAAVVVFAAGVLVGNRHSAPITAASAAAAKAVAAAKQI